MPPSAIHPQRLAPLLKALGSPVRLEILRQLQDPRTLKEIVLRPSRKSGGQVPDHAMSEAAVRKHLVQLIEIGAVQQRLVNIDGRKVHHYLVNH